MASNQNTENDTEVMNDWLNSMNTLLKSVDHDYIQSCSISIVPEELKNSSNEDAYMPRVVSIGPRFKGSREDLLLMEEVKLRSMLSLLHRAGNEGESKKYLEKCSKAIWKSDKEIRASYVSDIKLKKQELAKIMLVDGCFLLELLITKGFDTQLPSRLIPPGPAPKVLKDEDVLSDLILLENQIPILVLHKLSLILFPNVFQQQYREQRAIKINNLVLSILGYSTSSQVPNPSHIEAPHILDIVHFFVNSTRKVERRSDAVGNYIVPIIDTTQHPKLKLKRCASRLQAAGVSIKLAEETPRGVSWFSFLRNCFGGICIKLGNMLVTINNQVDAPAEEVKGLNFYFKFKKGKLEIAQLEITETTEAKWRNIIAWEHHKNNWKSSYIHVPEYESDEDNQISTGNTSGEFTAAALIFDGMICCAADVQLLKKKYIIVDHLKMSDEELEVFFHKMSFGVDPGIVDSSYVKMVDDLNNYSRAFFPLRMLRIFWHIFKCRLEGILNFLKQNYNFVAALLAFLTLVQTVYAILAYHLHK